MAETLSYGRIECWRFVVGEEVAIMPHNSVSGSSAMAGGELDDPEKLIGCTDSGAW
jgi:hypothetical protein